MANSRRPWHYLFPNAAIRQLRRMSGVREHEGPEVDDEPTRSDPSSPDSTEHASRNEDAVAVATQTRDELEASSDPQPAALFFSRLPPEIRRLIYAEVWRGYMADGRRIHVSTDGYHNRIHFAPCIVGDVYHGCSGGTGGGGGGAAHALRGMNERNILIEANANADGGPDPRLWWWWRWSLRLRWGPHTDCIARVVRSRTGPGARAAAPAASLDDTPPFMAMFLTSKRM
jgi:hypothetical protein